MTKAKVSTKQNATAEAVRGHLNSKAMDFKFTNSKVGDTVQWDTGNGVVSLEVHADPDATCEGCYFKRVACENTACSVEDREHGDSVVFVEAK